MHFPGGSPDDDSNSPAAPYVLLAALPSLAQATRKSPSAWAYVGRGRSGDEDAAVAWTSNDDLLLLDETQPRRLGRSTGSRPANGERAAALDRARGDGEPEARSSLREPPRSLSLALTGSTRPGRAGHVARRRSSSCSTSPLHASSGSAAGRSQDLPRLSPDGQRVAFVRARDLWVYDVSSKTETRLTADGSATVLNGGLSWVYWEEIFNHQEAGYWWSPDSSADRVPAHRRDPGIDEVGLPAVRHRGSGRRDPALPEGG